MSIYRKLLEITEGINLDPDFDFSTATPSDAIRYAVQQFTELQKESSYFGLEFGVDMKAWVRIDSEKCSTCLAGAVIFSELKPKDFQRIHAKRFSPAYMPEPVAARLSFVDQIRMYVESGAAPNEKSLYVKKYLNTLSNPGVFFDTLNAARCPRTGYDEKPLEMIRLVLMMADNFEQTPLTFTV